MLKLYLAPGTSSFATHIALNEIGTPYEIEALNFATKDTQSPGYLAINPEGKVPALSIDGRVLTEVAATLYYLARKHPEAKLWPEGDIEAEAQVLSWMSFTASTLHPSRALGPERMQLVFGQANRRLGSKEWAVGGRYSIADIHLFRVYWRFCSGLQNPEQFTALEAHQARMLARPAVKKTMEIEQKISDRQAK